jgi:hypothetical protein
MVYDIWYTALKATNSIRFETFGVYHSGFMGNLPKVQMVYL